MDKREFFEFLRDEIIEAMPELENAQFFTREVKKDNNRVYNALSHENQQKFREMTGEISHDSEMRYEEKAGKNLYHKNKEQKERAK